MRVVGVFSLRRLLNFTNFTYNSLQNILIIYYHSPDKKEHTQCCPKLNMKTMNHFCSCGTHCAIRLIVHYLNVKILIVHVGFKSCFNHKQRKIVNKPDLIQIVLCRLHSLCPLIKKKIQHKITVKVNLGGLTSIKTKFPVFSTLSCL